MEDGKDGEGGGGLQMKYSLKKKDKRETSKKNYFVKLNEPSCS